ncbi:MAG: hypothetical protein OXC07_03165 [Kistimonas sp.]|nr:hypothetical protein [Kistimonas sp.]
MKKIHALPAFFSLFFCFSLFGADNFNVKVLQKGKVSCHRKLAYDSHKKKISCEPSGVAYNKGNLYVVSDWWKHDKPRLFSYRWNGVTQLTEKGTQISNPLINSTKKLEDLSVSQDGKYIFATSSFVFSVSSYRKWKAGNRILYWPSHSTNQTQQLRFKEDTDESFLRKKLLNVINSKNPKAKFFKIESLATLPENKLLVGTREIGLTYEDFDYQSLLMTTSYKSGKDNNLYLDAPFKLITELKFADSSLQGDYALSSLEYDFDDHVLYALATRETKDASGSFSTSLWQIASSDNFSSAEGLSIKMATTDPGVPLLLPHKFEGISKTRDNHFIVIADDDRVLTTADGTRKPYETFYYILTSFTSG